MTLYERLKNDWKYCKRCPLYKTRCRVVMLRGKVPADIFFLGEAPGESENVIGKPFVGPAGKDSLCGLDRIIAEIPSSYRVAVGNLVGCIPKGKDMKKVGEPSKKALLRCKPRLLGLLKACKPSIIVCVGNLAWKELPREAKEVKAAKIVKIIHPAAILRMDVSQKGLATKRNLVTVRDVVEEILPF